MIPLDWRTKVYSFAWVSFVWGWREVSGKGVMTWEERTSSAWGSQASAPAGTGAMGMFSGPLSVCPGASPTSHSSGHPKWSGGGGLSGWSSHLSVGCSLFLLPLPER